MNFFNLVIVIVVVNVVRDTDLVEKRPRHRGILAKFQYLFSTGRNGAELLLLNLFEQKQFGPIRLLNCHVRF